MPTLLEDIKLSDRHDFSVSRALFVVLTMVVLSMLISVNFIPVGEQANRNLQQVGIKRVTRALNNYKSNMGCYPTKEEGLDVLWNQAAVSPRESSAWSGPYLSGPVRDRWGSAILYQWPSELSSSDKESKFDLHSPGPDGRINTSDDITNHDDRTFAGMDRAIESDLFLEADKEADAS